MKHVRQLRSKRKVRSRRKMSSTRRSKRRSTRRSKRRSKRRTRSTLRSKRRSKRRSRRRTRSRRRSKTQYGGAFGSGLVVKEKKTGRVGIIFREDGRHLYVYLRGAEKPFTMIKKDKGSQRLEHFGKTNPSLIENSPTGRYLVNQALKLNQEKAKTLEPDTSLHQRNGWDYIALSALQKKCAAAARVETLVPPDRESPEAEIRDSSYSEIGKSSEGSPSIPVMKATLRKLGVDTRKITELPHLKKEYRKAIEAKNPDPVPEDDVLSIQSDSDITVGSLGSTDSDSTFSNGELREYNMFHPGEIERMIREEDKESTFIKLSFQAQSLMDNISTLAVEIHETGSLVYYGGLYQNVETLKGLLVTFEEEGQRLAAAEMGDTLTQLSKFIHHGELILVNFLPEILEHEIERDNRQYPKPKPPPKPSLAKARKMSYADKERWREVRASFYIEARKYLRQIRKYPPKAVKLTDLRVRVNDLLENINIHVETIKHEVGAIREKVYPRKKPDGGESVMPDLARESESVVSAPKQFKVIIRNIIHKYPGISFNRLHNRVFTGDYGIPPDETSFSDGKGEPVSPGPFRDKFTEDDVRLAAEFTYKSMVEELVNKNLTLEGNIKKLQKNPRAWVDRSKGPGVLGIQNIENMVREWLGNEWGTAAILSYKELEKAGLSANEKYQQVGEHLIEKMEEAKDFFTRTIESLNGNAQSWERTYGYWSPAILQLNKSKTSKKHKTLTDKELRRTPYMMFVNRITGCIVEGLPKGGVIVFRGHGDEARELEIGVETPENILAQLTNKSILLKMPMYSSESKSKKAESKMVNGDPRQDERKRGASSGWEAAWNTKQEDLPEKVTIVTDKNTTERIAQSVIADVSAEGGRFNFIKEKMGGTRVIRNDWEGSGIVSADQVEAILDRNLEERP